MAGSNKLTGYGNRFVLIPLAVLLAFINTLAVVHAGNLPQQADRGKQIYYSGIAPNGGVINALVGKNAIQLPASTVPCASCHGPDGRGRPEGGVLPTDITWNYLTKSYGHQHSYGRKHPAFTESSVGAAITQGLDPAGNRLDASMPRYHMDQADLDALVTFLKQLETDRDPGLGAGSIQLATLLPTTGHLATLGKAMSAVMTASVQELNASGGVHGRSIELEVVPFGGSAQEAVGNLERALREQGIFALVGPFSVGLEAELARLAEEEHVPVVGPFTLTPALGHGLDRYTFYLFSGLEQQARVMVDYAALQLHGQEPGIAVVGPDTPSVQAIGEAVKVQARSHGWERVQDVHYPVGQLEPVQLAAELRAAGSKALFFFGTGAELERVLGVLDHPGQLPLVFLPSIVATPALLNAPPGFDGRLFVAYPTLPRDVTPLGREGYAALKQKYTLPTEHLSGQLAAYAAVRTLVEGLKRSGRDLSRERLVESLQGLYRFETGVTPPISYTLNRRIGALGAHIVQVDLKTRRYAPVGEWMLLK